MQDVAGGAVETPITDVYGVLADRLGDERGERPAEETETQRISETAAGNRRHRGPGRAAPLFKRRRLIMDRPWTLPR